MPDGDCPHSHCFRAEICDTLVAEQGRRLNLNIEAISESLQGVLTTTISRWRERCDWEVRYSGEEAEIATSVDLALEAEIKHLLASIRPQAAFLAEEEFKEKKLSLNLYAHCEEIWIVDPLDGTSNFVSGSDDFGMIVAYAWRGITTAAWILAPEKGVVCCAELGAGVRINGQIYEKCGLDRKASYGVLATGDFSPAEMAAAELLRAQLKMSRGTRSCAIDYIELVSGIVDFALYKRTRPWDHAGGVLAFSEAGGQHMTFSRRPYSIFEDNQGLLLATSTDCLLHAASILGLVSPR